MEALGSGLLGGSGNEICAELAFLWCLLPAFRGYVNKQPYTSCSRAAFFAGLVQQVIIDIPRVNIS